MMSGVPSVKFVREAFGRRDVQRDLRSLGFRAFLYGLNIYRLNRLDVEQYAKFKGFLGNIRAQAIINHNLGEDELLPLTLPGWEKLSMVNFEKLLADPDAMGRIYDECVFPDGKPEVNLNLLPKIYHLYVASPKPSR